ncbi:TadE/TadG family type IV pilus assembly protein [Kitasatospora arboriphila]|uniref:Pilus assembly protein n=1 Tax=Kitasatospora arboriphila TaxID=258052 RepID=A0ABN1U7G3_9ACTN
MPRRAAADPARRDRGSATTETVLAAPLLIMLLLIAVGAGRMTAARLGVEDAAHQAARAASLARTPGAARAAARHAADQALAGAGLACQQTAVTVDTAAFRPGGHVTATVSCTASLAGLAGAPLPGQRRLSQAFTSPVDTYRATGPA